MDEMTTFTDIDTQNQIILGEPSDISNMPGRISYEKPVLIEYGTLAKLTQTGEGTADDGGSGLFHLSYANALVPW